MLILLLRLATQEKKKFFKNITANEQYTQEFWWRYTMIFHFCQHNQKFYVTHFVAVVWNQNQISLRLPSESKSEIFVQLF